VEIYIAFAKLLSLESAELYAENCFCDVNLQQKLCTASHFLSEQIGAGVEHLILLLLNYLESTVNTSFVLLPGVVLIIGQ
jgi:hypothetical protein